MQWEYFDWYERVVALAKIKYDIDSDIIEAFNPEKYYNDDYTPSQFIEFVANQLNFDVERNSRL